MKKFLYVMIPVILVLATVITILAISNKKPDNSESEEKKDTSKSAKHKYSITLYHEKGDISDEEAERVISIIKERLAEDNIKNVNIESSGFFFFVTIKSQTELDTDSFDYYLQPQQLTFRKGTDANGEIILTNDDIKTASANIHPENGTNIVSLEFTEEGRVKFAEATKKLIGSTISIWLDDICIFAPTVNSVIDQGTCYIDGMSTTEETQELAAKMVSRALPFPIYIISAE